MADISDWLIFKEWQTIDDVFDSGDHFFIERWWTKKDQVWEKASCVERTENGWEAWVSPVPGGEDEGRHCVFKKLQQAIDWADSELEKSRWFNAFIRCAIPEDVRVFYFAEIDSFDSTRSPRKEAFMARSDRSLTACLSDSGDLIKEGVKDAAATSAVQKLADLLTKKFPVLALPQVAPFVPFLAAMLMILASNYGSEMFPKADLAGTVGQRALRGLTTTKGIEVFSEIFGLIDSALELVGIDLDKSDKD